MEEAESVPRGSGGSMAEDGAGATSSVGSIRRALWRGGAWTKRQISEETGVSPAMSSLVLNELARTGEVIGVPRRNGRAGRAGLAYHVDERHAPVLCLRVELAQGGWLLTGETVSVLGTVLDRRTETCGEVGPQAVEALARACLAAHPGTVEISLGIPGNIVGEAVLSCDAPALDGAEMLERLRALGHPLLAFNDAHAMALGFYREAGDGAQVVSVAFFPEGVMPGMATVHRGRVLTGASNFAGMLGYVPFADDVPGNRALWTGPRGLDLAARSLAALVAAVNPATILCAGSLVDVGAVERLAARLADWIPAEHLPRLVYREDLDGLYRRGLLSPALERRLGGA